MSGCAILSSVLPGQWRLAWPRYAGSRSPADCRRAVLAGVVERRRWRTEILGARLLPLDDAPGRYRPSAAAQRAGCRLRQAGDAIFLLRRARRNCQAGWMCCPARTIWRHRWGHTSGCSGARSARMHFGSHQGRRRRPLTRCQANAQAKVQANASACDRRTAIFDAGFR